MVSIKKILLGLKKLLLHELSNWILLLVWAVVFALTLGAGHLLVGQDLGFVIGGGIGFVLASLTAYAVSKRLPYAFAKDIQ